MTSSSLRIKILVPLSRPNSTGDCTCLVSVRDEITNHHVAYKSMRIVPFQTQYKGKPQDPLVKLLKHVSFTNDQCDPVLKKTVCVTPDLWLIKENEYYLEFSDFSMYTLEDVLLTLRSLVPNYQEMQNELLKEAKAREHELNEDQELTHEQAELEAKKEGGKSIAVNANENDYDDDENSEEEGDEDEEDPTLGGFIVPDENENEEGGSNSEEGEDEEPTTEMVVDPVVVVPEPSSLKRSYSTMDDAPVSESESEEEEEEEEEDADESEEDDDDNDDDEEEAAPVAKEKMSKSSSSAFVSQQAPVFCGTETFPLDDVLVFEYDQKTNSSDKIKIIKYFITQSDEVKSEEEELFVGRYQTRHATLKQVLKDQYQLRPDHDTALVKFWKEMDLKLLRLLAQFEDLGYCHLHLTPSSILLKLVIDPNIDTKKKQVVNLEFQLRDFTYAVPHVHNITTDAHLRWSRELPFEVYVGNEPIIGTKVDVWAMGIILADLRFPFHGFFPYIPKENRNSFPVLNKSNIHQYLTQADHVLGTAEINDLESGEWIPEDTGVIQQAHLEWFFEKAEKAGILYVTDPDDSKGGDDDNNKKKDQRTNDDETLHFTITKSNIDAFVCDLKLNDACWTEAISSTYLLVFFQMFISSPFVRPSARELVQELLEPKKRRLKNNIAFNQEVEHPEQLERALYTPQYHFRNVAKKELTSSLPVLRIQSEDLELFTNELKLTGWYDSKTIIEALYLIQNKGQVVFATEYDVKYALFLLRTMHGGSALEEEEEQEYANGNWWDLSTLVRILNASEITQRPVSHLLHQTQNILSTIYDLDTKYHYELDDNVCDEYGSKFNLYQLLQEIVLWTFIIDRTSHTNSTKETEEVNYEQYISSSWEKLRAFLGSTYKGSRENILKNNPKSSTVTPWLSALYEEDNLISWIYDILNLPAKPNKTVSPTSMSE
jgi:hypothetical protein